MHECHRDRNQMPFNHQPFRRSQRDYCFSSCDTCLSEEVRQLCEPLPQFPARHLGNQWGTVPRSDYCMDLLILLRLYPRRGGSQDLRDHSAQPRTQVLLFR